MPRFRFPICRRRRRRRAREESFARPGSSRPRFRAVVGILEFLMTTEPTNISATKLYCVFSSPYSCLMWQSPSAVATTSLILLCCNVAIPDTFKFTASRGDLAFLLPLSRERERESGNFLEFFSSCVRRQSICPSVRRPLPFLPALFHGRSHSRNA